MSAAKWGRKLALGQVRERLTLWVCSHTIAGALYGLVSAALWPGVASPPTPLLARLALAIVFGLLNGAILGLMLRHISGRLIGYSLIAGLATLFWLLAVPLGLGVPTQLGLPQRMVAAAGAGWFATFVLTRALSVKGASIRWYLSSAVAWAVMQLLDTFIGETMRATLDVPLAAAALSGTLCGAGGGLASVWLAAVSAGGEPAERGRRWGAMIEWGMRWLAGCAAVGLAAGLVTAGLNVLVIPPIVVPLADFVPFGGLVAVIGSGGGFMLAWMRGEEGRMALRRALGGFLGALFGLAFAIGAILPFAYNVPMSASILAGALVGLCTGVGQDGAAPPGSGRSPWWPVAMLLTLGGGWPAAIWFVSASPWLNLLLGYGGTLGSAVGFLVVGSVSGAAGGLLGLPAALVALASWRQGPEAHRAEDSRALGL